MSGSAAFKGHSFVGRTGTRFQGYGNQELESFYLKESHRTTKATVGGSRLGPCVSSAQSHSRAWLSYRFAVFYHSELLGFAKCAAMDCMLRCANKTLIESGFEC